MTMTSRKWRKREENNIRGDGKIAAENSVEGLRRVSNAAF